MATKEPDASITSATSEATALLNAAFSDLAKTVGVKAAVEPRVFFPNGIELISITVSVSAVKVELKVAGEKGISALLVSGSEGNDRVTQENTGHQEPGSTNV